MTGEQIDELAAAVVERLQGAVIPSSLPADIGQAIGEAASNGAVYWLHSLPLQGAYSIATYWTLAPDGSLHLELRRWDGSTFWRGTLQPVAAPA